MDDFDIDNVEERKTYEINQLYQTNEEDKVNIALKIKEAIDIAMKNCAIKDTDYSIIAEIEKKSIEMEEKKWKERKKMVTRLMKGVVSPNNHCWEEELEEMKMQKEINEVISKNVVSN